MSDKKIIVAIDGHSSCGKSTMAKVLAKRVGYIYVDSGAMYRAVTLYAMRNGWIDTEHLDKQALLAHLKDITICFELNAETGNPMTILNGENVEQQIRSMNVSQLVSPISAISEVRSAMVAQQQLMGKAKGIVMDGRDIGSVVFPNAELKVFVTASAEIRAERRVKELEAKGEKVSFDEVLRNVKSRDEIDSNRKDSPLLRTKDALLIDNSNLSFEEQNELLYSYFLKATKE